MASNFPDRGYQVIYGVVLLDDLHNYFPSLLYDQRQFQTLEDVFHYVRQQLNSRFNLYSYGSSQAQEHVRRRSPQPTVVQQFDRDSVQITEHDLSTNAAAAIFLLNMLNTEPRTNRSAEVWRSFRQPVPIIPSEQVLREHTEVISGSTLTENSTEEQVCSICQERILAAETCRRLLPCRHTYHRTCIDTWFYGHVHCPTCRHDIRERIVQDISGSFVESSRNVLEQLGAMDNTEEEEEQY
jgi:hypothetical protein